MDTPHDMLCNLQLNLYYENYRGNFYRFQLNLHLPGHCWNPQLTGSTPDTLATETEETTLLVDQQTVVPTGPSHLFPIETGHCMYTPVAPTTNDGFQASMLVINAVTVASLAVWEAPDFPNNDAQVANIFESDFTPEKTLRGVDGSTLTSIGSVVDKTTNGNNDTVENNTSLCLFQTPYPVSVYCNGGFAAAPGWWEPLRADSSGNPFTYKVQPRNREVNPVTVGYVDCLPALVIKAGSVAGTKIRYTNLNGDTWVYTLPSTAGSTYLATASAGVSSVSGFTGLPVDVDGDEILIEAHASATEELNLCTVSLWEQ